MLVVRSGSNTVLTPLKWDVCINPESRHRSATLPIASKMGLKSKNPLSEAVRREREERSNVLKLKDGKITEEIGLDDGVTALQQLGLIKLAA